MEPSSVLFIFPHQLFVDHPGLASGPTEIILIEHPLFFGDERFPARFHKQKLFLHRASMKKYADHLTCRGFTVRYVGFEGPADPLDGEVQRLAKAANTEITACDCHDFILEKRLMRTAKNHGVSVKWLETPAFLNSRSLNRQYRSNRKRWFMADFYQFQRKRLDILIDKQGKPVGGQWSFDADNRKKVPKKLLGSIPGISARPVDDVERSAVEHVEQNHGSNPGSLQNIWFPTDHDGAALWLDGFLQDKLSRFGDYEDAIVEDENWLWHSVLTPMLNIGLLTPRQIILQTLKHAETSEVPLNSLEGFLRQIIGWREFMRATYDDSGVAMRTTNHWNHNRPMPEGFYTGETGMPPIDDCIKRILETGYCHHIERLMVLGGFMFLCEIDPDHIYKWFMEMFADSYDWVMVPNVYAMSQNADGGTITTKPYFSGSAYIRRMSHYPKGNWCDVWDGLYWRWIDKHKRTLSANPRWAMMCKSVENMALEKLEKHKANAENYLKNENI